MADLIKPIDSVNPLCTDPTALFNPQSQVDCRPVAVGRFKLQELAGYVGVDGGAQFMTPQFFPANTPLVDMAGTVYTLAQPRLLFYVAYGAAGVVKLDWSNPARAVDGRHQGHGGLATATAISNGRVYVADGTGGLVVFK